MERTLMSKKLTSEYLDDTLADGNYYISVAGTAPQVATFKHPSIAEKTYRANNSLPKPQSKLFCEGIVMIGALKTVAILARVPDYEDLTEEQEQCC